MDKAIRIKEESELQAEKAIKNISFYLSCAVYGREKRISLNEVSEVYEKCLDILKNIDIMKVMHG